MRRRMRSEDLIAKTKKDTEFGQELGTPNVQKMLRNDNLSTERFANNPRPKYEIYPGE